MRRDAEDERVCLPQNLEIDEAPPDTDRRTFMTRTVAVSLVLC